MSLSVLAETGDWPQFRGPGGLGTSPAKGLPLTWSQTENLVWKAELPGPGTSSPVVVGSRIFLTCYSGYNVPRQAPGNMSDLKLHLVCLNRDDGSRLWAREIEPKLPEQERIREGHGYASSSPAADGDGVYAFFGKSGVCAFDLEGKPRWRTEVGSGISGWGSAASPVLAGNLVIVNASVESQSLVALDKKTGEEKWRAKGIREAWNTPILVPLKDGKQELVVGMIGKVLGFEPATGENLWSCANDITWYIAPSAVAQDGVVWSIGGRSGIAAVAVRAGGRGDVTATHRLWTGQKGSNVSSPVLHEGHLYWMHDNTGTAYCAEAMTGTILYEERIPRAGQIYASALLADGKVYYLSRGGRTYVVAAKPQYELLATNELADGSMFNASPAVSGNKILIRSDLSLYCLGRK
jgi:outer membrane protein assembly factor BamB